MLKEIIKRVFHLFNLEIVNYEAFQSNNKLNHQKEKERESAISAINRLTYLVSKSQFDQSNGLREFEFLRFSCDNLLKSKAQLFQDLFVLYCLKNKRNGFFIEFGATDGITLSNSYLLEKEYQWSGILCEPAKVWQQKIQENRSVTIDFRCVWSKSGEDVQFNETKVPELSSIELFNDSDYHSESRKGGNGYSVRTISLNDLLNEHKAPRNIDYLSIDTEGSEYEILNAFDFTKFTIAVITVEHNFSSNRDKIYELLTSNGYKRVFERVSLFDDWYVHDTLN